MDTVKEQPTNGTPNDQFVIKLPEQTKIILQDYLGFEFVCPNGTDIYTINQALGEFLKWIRQQIQKHQPTAH